MDDDPKFRIYVDRAANCAFIRHVDVISLQILMARANALHNHPDFHNNMNKLIDMRGCRIDITADEVRIYSNQSIGLGAKGIAYKAAILVNSDIAHGMSRMFMSFFNNANIQGKIFNSPENALAWLGLGADFNLPYVI